MSDHDDMQDNDGGEGMVPRSQIRVLEQKAKKAEEAEARAEALERQMAFIRAGVDLDSKAGQYFMRAYDGDLTTEAIQAEATEVGALARQESAPQPEAQQAPQVEVSDEEKAAAKAAADAASGSPADIPTEKHPGTVADETAEQVLKQGGSREAALAASVGSLFAAAKSGDDRALWSPQG